MLSIRAMTCPEFLLQSDVERKIDWANLKRCFLHPGQFLAGLEFAAPKSPPSPTDQVAA